MTRPKPKTEDLLLSKTKICETINKQAHTKKHLNLNSPNQEKLFRLNHLIILLDSEGMLRLTSLEVYNSVFNRTIEGSNFMQTLLMSFHLFN